MGGDASMLLIFFLSVVFAFVFYRMTPEERARVLQAALASIRQLKDAAARGRSRGRAECEPFRDALRARTPWSTWGLLHRSDVTIPLAAVQRLAPDAVVFVLYNMAGDGLGSTAELIGLFAGIVCGLVLARGVSSGTPPARRVAATMAAAFAIAVASAVVLRGVTDVRP